MMLPNLLRLTFPLFILLAPPQSDAQPPPPDPSSAAAATHLDFHVAPFIDMHYWARRLAADSTAKPPEMTGLDAAIQALRELDAEVGGGLGWGFVEPTLAACSSADEVVQKANDLPETFELRSGRTMHLREPLRRVAKAYVVIEPAFREQLWPSHLATIERGRRNIREEFEPKATQALADMMDRLAMKDPNRPIPVHLVAQAPFPQAFTHRQRGGGGICFVGINAASGTQLYETILHEAIHALDIATQDQETALQSLRRGLREAGLTEDDKLFRDVPHTLMFVQAGETIRRVVDPQHRHYGDVEGYYAKVPDAARIVRGAWTDYLDGNCARDEALKRMIDETSSLRPP